MQTIGWSLVSQGSVKTLGWHWEICPVHRGWGGLFRGGLKASAVVLCEGKVEYAGLWWFIGFHAGRHRCQFVVLRAMGVSGMVGLVA
jgi:hypothetical protein